MFSNINKAVLKNIPLIKTTFLKPSNLLTKVKTEQNICTLYVCTFRSHFLTKESFFLRTTNILTLSKEKYSSNSTDIKQNKFSQFSVKDNRKNVFISFVIIATCTAGIYVTYKLKKQSSKRLVEEVKEGKIILEIKKDKPNRFPVTSDEIPNHVPYLLIGGGTASFSAFRAIKSSDPTAKVLVISNEVNYPYMRPPLSKEIWFNEDRQLMKNLKFKQWNGSERSLFYEPEDFYVDCKELLNMTNGGIAVARGWTVIKLDPTKRVAYLDDNKQITYDKCLIATGARPKNLDIFEKAHDNIKQKVTLFRTVDDFENLEEICNNIKNVSVIGGGFLGSEISCALARYGRNKGLKVKQIFREKGNMAKVLPGYLSEWTTKKIEQEGVEVLTDTNIDNVNLDPTTNQLHLILNDGTKIETDHVIVAVGVTPNTDLAETSGLEIDPVLGGFLVNAELEARSNLYAAGDCACFYDVKLGRRRVEHHDHAVVSGRLAGENMAGAKKPFTHQSMFWSDLGPEIGYEAIGIIDSNLSTMSVFAKTENNLSPNITIQNTSTEGELENKQTEQKQDAMDGDFSKGIIFYLKNNIIVGIVLWNVFNRMSTARQVIKEHTTFDDLTEVAKLFNIYEE